MERLVLDTNSLIQCVARRNQYHELWLSLIRGQNQLCVTTDILNEYEEILERKASHEFASLVISIITNSQYTLFVDPVYHFKVIDADPDDNKFIDCAVAAHARCIISNDRHFSHLDKFSFPFVEIVKLEDAVKQFLNTPLLS